MKLLPKKQDIQKLQVAERKKDIDYGVNLARSVDKIRETKLAEEKQLKDWRVTAIKQVQQEIDSYIEVRDNLKKETEKQETYRKELIKPLDDEWAEVNRIKVKVNKELNDNYIFSEQLKLQEKEIEKEKSKVSKIVSQVSQNEKDTEKVKEEAVSLKDLAQKEYEMARSEHETQTNQADSKLSELNQRKKEYEVALSVIAIRENEVKEKEADIIKREKHLASQQAQLRVVREALKQ